MGHDVLIQRTLDLFCAKESAAQSVEAGAAPSYTPDELEIMHSAADLTVALRKAWEV